MRDKPSHTKPRYGIDNWSDAHFAIDAEGRVIVRAGDDHTTSIPLVKLVEKIETQGIAPPYLMRFPNLLHDRVKALYSAMQSSFKYYDYQGGFQALYPVKVNPHITVIEEILKAGRNAASQRAETSPGIYRAMGLETGSKTELMLALTLLIEQTGSITDLSHDFPILCNGFKDRQMLTLIRLAQGVGLRITPVLESLQEVERWISVVTALAVDVNPDSTHPISGLRLQLDARRFGGESHPLKFGFNENELNRAVERLTEAGLIQGVQLLHGHLGTQMASRDLRRKSLVALVSHWVALHKAGVPLTTLDVGGGLAINYTGEAPAADGDESGPSDRCIPSDKRDAASPQESNPFSQPVDDLVETITVLCRRGGVPHPDILTENGRAMVAHHMVLISNLLPGDNGERRSGQVQDNPIQVSASRSGFRDTVDAPVAQWDWNLSLFRTLPDHISVGHPFPVMPLSELNARRWQRGQLRDLTCDADGIMHSYAGDQGSEKRLPLPVADDPNSDHATQSNENPEPHGGHLGVFLVGAYQEILGSAHNLFGRLPVIMARHHGGEERADEKRTGQNGDEVRQTDNKNPQDDVEPWRVTIVDGGESVADLLRSQGINLPKPLNHAHPPKIPEKMPLADLKIDQKPENQQAVTGKRTEQSVMTQQATTQGTGAAAARHPNGQLIKTFLACYSAILHQPSTLSTGRD